MISTDVQPSPTPSDDEGLSLGVRILRGALVVAGVLLAVYVVLVLTNRGDIARGTTVLGVDIGGQSVDEAAATLQSELAADTTAVIPVRAAGTPIDVEPAQSGLSLDATATAEAAAGTTLNPVELFMRYFREPTVDPVVAVDDAALSASVAEIATQVDQQARDGDVTFNGAQVVPVEPLVGRVLDQEQAKTALTEAYLVADDPVDLTVEETEPAIGSEAVGQALSTFANAAASSPLTLVLGDKGEVVVDPATTLAFVDMVPQGGALVPTLNVAGLRQALGGQLAPAETAPVDARFDISSGTPVIVPSADGTTLTDQALNDTILAALPVQTDRRAEVPLEVKPPALSTTQAQALGVNVKVSEFTTNHPAGQSRVTNIHRAADTLRGTLVLPGETFSLNGVLGERTAAKGYVEAPAILNGRLIRDVGGGVSQLATTTYNAMFFAGLEDVYHKPHSFYISRYPVGREATVDYPSVDLKWRNDTATAILIDTSYTSSSITVSFWGTKYYDIEEVTSGRTNVRSPETIYDASEGCVPQSPAEGFSVTVTRIFKQNGVEVKRDSDTTTYIPEDRVYCRAGP